MAGKGLPCALDATGASKRATSVGESPTASLSPGALAMSMLCRCSGDELLGGACVAPVLFVAVEPAFGVSWQHAVLYLLRQHVALQHFIFFILGLAAGVAGTTLAIACFGAVRCARGGGGSSTARRFGSPLREGSAASLGRWTPQKRS